MRALTLLVVSELLLVLTIVFVSMKLSGSVNFSAGTSLRSFSLAINGTAQGGWVLLALLCLVASIVTFIVGVVTTMRTR